MTNYDNYLPLFECSHFEARSLAADVAMEALGVITTGAENLTCPRAYKAGFEMTRDLFDLDRSWYTEAPDQLATFRTGEDFRERAGIVLDAHIAHSHAIDIVSYALRAEPMILDEFKAGVNGGAANLNPLVKAVLDDEGWSLSVKRIDGRDSWGKRNG